MTVKVSALASSIIDKVGLDPEDADSAARLLLEKKLGPATLAKLLAFAGDLVQRASIPTKHSVAVAQALMSEQYGVCKYGDLADISEDDMRTAEGLPKVAITKLLRARSILVSVTFVVYYMPFFIYTNVFVYISC